MNEDIKYTILYVDDEESNLRIFKNTFRRQYNIVTASSGIQGLELLENGKIDLILTDQRMPGMSGVDFLKKTIDKFPELNRIMITAYTDYDILREAVNSLKIFHYIEKPWKEEEIRSTIDRALELHRLKNENKELSTSLLKNNNELKRINEELNEEIDKHKTTQLELIREKEYAENCNRLKSSFLANMSHEIRTPMNSIMGFMDLIDEENTSVNERKEYMGIIQRSCIQLLHIIDDIVEISKIDSGNIELKRSFISINELLKNLFNIYKIQAKVDFKLTSLVPESNSSYYYDATKLEQILVNLIGNAIKFTEYGHIYFGAELNGETVTFFVEDTGVGISSDNFELIFQRFSQVDGSHIRKFGGNGLGLAISKGYVEKMGGKIWVESEIDMGSRFLFTLPLG